ncbi:MAG: phosphoglucosamine mutase, partial [Deltaproteobacteria bacterium]|nr:phosphoglucosamine mutase [Deltaproteobacteria bacterium]
YLVGVLPTPAVAFLTESMRVDAGIVISASHNPFQDNGIKIFSSDGYKLPDDKEDELEKLILEGNLDDLLPGPWDMGRARRIEDARGRYIVFAKNAFPRDLSMEGLKIVLDVGNGATYKAAPAAFFELGADVTTINNEPDGLNINLNCGSQHTDKGLEAMVKESGAAVGLAFDGDGDRLIAVDEKGNTLTGDQVLIIIANSLKRIGQLSSNILVTTVMSNIGFKLACKKYGFTHHAAKVGDRYVLEDMLQLGARLGGEDSGHTIFLDHHTTGDGIVTAMQLIAAILREDKPLSELAQQMEVFPQELINVEVQSKPVIETLDGVTQAISRAEHELGEEGRVLVRYSGTQNLCRVMVEGPTKEKTKDLCEMIAYAIEKTIGTSKE